MSGTFTFEEPTTIDEALHLLASGDETVRVVGGGTGLTLLMKYGFFEPTQLISLRRLASGMSGIDVEADGTIRLGALATLRDLEDSPVVAERLPLLHEALRVLATVRLRNVAQLGGAIAHGHPQMDLPPALLALDAQVRVKSQKRERWIPADGLFLGYYETAVEDDELITEVRIPALGDHRATYRKITARAVDDWPMLGLAVLVTTAGDGSIGTARVAVGALGDRAERLRAAEQALTGQQATAEAVHTAARAGAEAVDYHGSPNATARYQRHLVEVHLRRALTDVLGTSVLGTDGRA